MKFLLAILLPAVATQMGFFSEEDYWTESLQARTGMPVFTSSRDVDYYWAKAVCGDISLDTAHWICRKQGHARGALSVMRNSAAPGRTGPTKAMMTVMRRFFTFITNLNCPQDARGLDAGCTVGPRFSDPRFSDTPI